MLKELQEKHRKLASDYKALMETVKTEKREALNDDERAKVKVMNDDLSKLEELIEVAKRAENLDKELGESAGRLSGGPMAGSQLSQGAAQADRDQRLALRGWLMDQMGKDVPEAHREAARRTGVRLDRDNYEVAWRAPLADTQITSNSELSVTSSEVGRAVERAQKQFGPILEHIHEFNTGDGNPFRWPTGDETSREATIVGETELVSNTKVLFDGVVFTAYKLTSGIFKVSSEMFQDNVFNIEEYIGSVIGESFGRGKSRYLTTGNNTNQPQGIIACDTGATGAANTALAAQVVHSVLVDLFHSVDPAYRGNAKWMFDDDMLKILRTVRDPATDELIWQPDLVGSAPATILGKPYVVNQSMPAHAAGAAGIVFGELRNYKARQVANIIIKKDTSRYMEYDATAFVAFARFDGRLVDPGKGIKKFVFGTVPE
jgi:HK97 family phage major capsid protein